MFGGIFININKKPVNRSKLRLVLGRKYYTLKRYLKWTVSSDKYARSKETDRKKYMIFKHSSPLFRKLRNVDMKLQHNKVINLKIACNRVNGIVIKPGETFSYWRTIGKPSKFKGYVEGLVLCPDGTFKAGTAGGLCQLSNLIYWMTLHTPLKVVERYRHSHDVFPDTNRTQPFGSGATCVYNYIDLQIYNGTDEEYQLILSITDDKLVGEWRSEKECPYTYEVYEKEHSITTGLWGGYMRNNIIYRKVYNRYNDIIEDEFVTENHAIMMYAPFLQENKNKGKDKIWNSII